MPDRSTVRNAARRYWRLAVVAAAAFVILDALFGAIAYNSATMNADHTEVLTRWAAVRYVSLIMFPTIAAAAGLLCVTLCVGIGWAARDASPSRGVGKEQPKPAALEICGKRISGDHWSCFLPPDHPELWHMTQFGQTWHDGDKDVIQGFQPVDRDIDAVKSRGMVGP